MISLSSTPVRTTVVNSSAYTFGSICFFHTPVLPVCFLPTKIDATVVEDVQLVDRAGSEHAPPAIATNFSPGFHSGMPPEGEPAA